MLHLILVQYLKPALSTLLLLTLPCPRSLLPVITALRNPVLKERHWFRVVEAVEAAGGARLEMTLHDEGFTLQVTYEAGLKARQTGRQLKGRKMEIHTHRQTEDRGRRAGKGYWRDCSS